MINQVIIADNQAITQAGMIHLLITNYAITSSMIDIATNKNDLTRFLLRHPSAIVILDYTLSELNSSNELLIYIQRFPEANWLLFSEELSEGFLRHIIPVTCQIGIILKGDSFEEIHAALQHTLQHQRYICSQVSNLLLSPHSDIKKTLTKDLLTSTERTILREIALGKTTKEIAAERNLSFHTINSHRKNIFRKLEVNNIHEATKYAMRAGIVDMAEYYI